MPRSDPSPVVGDPAASAVRRARRKAGKELERRAALGGFGRRWTPAAAVLRKRICVLSPHLDDAVFSLGAALAAAARTGADVRVITIFAGDRESRLPASRWDAKAGFASSGDAARVRQIEDARACRLLGVKPVWLPFFDELYDGPATDDELWSALAPNLDCADLVLTPGFPLMHQDHVRVCRLVRARLHPRLVGYYVEQPYAAWLQSGHSLRRPAEDEIAQLHGHWRRLRTGVQSWAGKLKAMRTYRSQLEALDQPVTSVLFYELLRGGESVALPSS